LLVEGELQRAWKAAGLERQPLVTCATLRPILARIAIKRIRLASAGGARCKFGEMSGAFLVDGVMTAEDQRAMYEGQAITETIGLRQFVESPAVVIGGELIARRVVIKYVANKLGGAHHDQKRGTDHEETLYRLLDETRDWVLMDKPAIYFELLSIGQALASSNDMARFVHAVASRAV
jgi:hypothetical protein